MQTKEAFDQLGYLRELISQTRLRVADSYLHFLVWGVLWMLGFLGSIWLSYYIWVVIGPIGAVISGVIGFRNKQKAPPPALLKKIGWLIVVLLIYMSLLFSQLLMLGENTQLLNSFWPFHFGLLYILAGIFWGHQMILIGGWLMAVAVVGYWVPNPLQEIWLALGAGGGLILTGILLRKQVAKDE